MTNPIVERLRERCKWLWPRDRLIDATLMDEAADTVERLSAELKRSLGFGWKFQIGDRVTKISGSSWTGKVVGYYHSSLTPRGYDVESENEPGSVQIYPESALKFMEETDGRT